MQAGSDHILNGSVILQSSTFQDYPIHYESKGEILTETTLSSAAHGSATGIFAAQHLGLCYLLTSRSGQWALQEMVCSPQTRARQASP